jgi:hypothetical protein
MKNLTRIGGNPWIMDSKRHTGPPLARRDSRTSTETRPSALNTAERGARSSPAFIVSDDSDISDGLSAHTRTGSFRSRALRSEPADARFRVAAAFGARATWPEFLVKS